MAEGGENFQDQMVRLGQQFQRTTLDIVQAAVATLDEQPRTNIGQLKPFTRHIDENWSQWFKDFDRISILSGCTTPQKKLVLLPTFLRGAARHLFDTIEERVRQPANFDAWIAEFARAFPDNRNADTYKERYQREEETALEYATVLRDLARRGFPDWTHDQREAHARTHFLAHLHLSIRRWVQSANKVTFDQVINEATKQEIRDQQERNEQQSIATPGNDKIENFTSNAVTEEGTPAKDPRRCFYCKKRGHIQRNCWHWLEEQAQYKYDDEQEEYFDQQHDGYDEEYFDQENDPNNYNNNCAQLDPFPKVWSPDNDTYNCSSLTIVNENNELELAQEVQDFSGKESQKTVLDKVEQILENKGTCTTDHLEIDNGLDKGIVHAVELTNMNNYEVSAEKDKNEINGKISCYRPKEPKDGHRTRMPMTPSTGNKGFPNGVENGRQRRPVTVARFNNGLRFPLTILRSPFLSIMFFLIIASKLKVATPQPESRTEKLESVYNFYEVKDAMVQEEKKIDIFLGYEFKMKPARLDKFSMSSTTIIIDKFNIAVEKYIKNEIKQLERDSMEYRDIEKAMRKIRMEH